MNEKQIQDKVQQAVEYWMEEDLQSVETFEEAGVLTGNKGLVLRMADGSEFQVTLVQSR